MHVDLAVCLNSHFLVITDLTIFLILKTFYRLGSSSGTVFHCISFVLVKLFFLRFLKYVYVTAVFRSLLIYC